MTGDDEEVGKSIKFTIAQSRAKFVYSNGADDAEDEKTVFSYDQETSTDGKPLEQMFDKWRQEGFDVEGPKKYLDVIVLVQDENIPELDSTMVTLSVPPSGIARFSGYMLNLKHQGKDYRSIITEAYVGKKVTKTKNAFYPWMFKEAK